jgi:hypothetical protein
MDLMSVLRRRFSHLIYDQSDTDDVGEMFGWGGDPPGALLYSSLFCPPLTEMDGMVVQRPV